MKNKPETAGDIYSRRGNIIIVSLALLMLLSSCAYEKKYNITQNIGCGALDDSGKRIVFFRSYAIYRHARGVNTLPDGGTPEYFYKNVSLYIFNKNEGTVRKIHDFGEDFYNGWPSQYRYRLCWEKDAIIIGLDNMVDDEKSGMFYIKSDGSDFKLLPTQGMMPELSPDAESIVYIKQVNPEKYEIWKLNLAMKMKTLLYTMYDFRPIFIQWEHYPDTLLVYVSDSGDFKVKRFELEKRKLENTDLPYLKDYGNHRIPTEQLENLDAGDWGVPEAPNK